MTEKMLTVTALTRYIKHKFETDQHLRGFWLKGEISNFKHHNRGHMYLTLKDQGAQIQAVMFQGYNRQLAFTPENGMDVLVRGEISVYEPQGKYQLYIHEMIPDGVGALHLAYEQLKEKLEKEGLFDATRKKTLPKFPKHIAVLTARTGAAVRDILSTLEARYPVAKVTVYQTLVQGTQAKDDIVKRLNQVNVAGEADVIILGRGGGSIEDLWPFNEEAVARAIAASVIPVISGVGHETDVTITDFVSDYRAPTPTGAAVAAVPELSQVKQALVNNKAKMDRRMKQMLSVRTDLLVRLKASYAFKYPKRLVMEKEQKLDQLLERLSRKMEQRLENERVSLDFLSQRLKVSSFQQRLKQERVAFNKQKTVLDKAMLEQINKKQFAFDKVVEALDLISPLKTMQRGYSLVYREDSTLIKTTKDVSVGERIRVKLSKGSLNCLVESEEE